jgi:uncharacterized lipoprotein YmbA
MGLAMVHAAPYPPGAGRVPAGGEHEVREAQYHLWAEPLHRGIHYYLEDRIATELGRQPEAKPVGKGASRYRVDVRVREFHGDLEGTVRLLAKFTLTEVENGEVLTKAQVSFKEQQPAPGHAALVQTQIELLDRLATSIVAALREVGLVPVE